MATKKNMQLGEGFKNLQRQFQNLDPKDPSLWPAAPRWMLLIVIAALVVGLGWYFYLSSFDEELTTSQGKELQLKEDYKSRLRKAVNLEALRKQREQVLQYVTQLEKQLPSKAEMAALLSDINQAGIGRSLQFDLFKPGQTVVKDYYAELPISLKVNGKYHDIGFFAADVANLSRIVTLNNMSLAPANKDSEMLVLDATARTFRYLDPQELKEQQDAKTKAKK
ncbi:type IV pilus assembly protein PilO [Comamonas odontotermitis]|uniref:Type IV pilus assembly protein PilO n=1 Tax=Comamonas odontotermitis TaxID=379895 RepID=A0ABR6RE92_9BURK|nr:type 4a pilus biogenesis protein PilO [Comamonas odontotermitis]MBB6577475.1 type IV pilus assembly protein PilO [Comamonas odontotermitis]